MRHAFDAALEAVRRRESEPTASPRLPDVVAALPDGAPAPQGGHSLWEFAAAWTPEADPAPPRATPAPPPEPPRPSVRAEDIAVELNLRGLRTTADVARARRRFMWDNHPDRRNGFDLDLANRRVAIANMLLDRALCALMKRRGR